MARQLTRIELAQIVARQNDELLELRSENSALRTQLEASKPRYPFQDKLGRAYRIERGVKCFKPTN